MMPVNLYFQTQLLQIEAPVKKRRQTMIMLIFVLTVAGLAGLAFGAWGIYTPEGRSQYDEMDGIYPYASGLLGGILIAIAILVSAFLLWKKWLKSRRHGMKSSSPIE